MADVEDCAQSSRIALTTISARGRAPLDDRTGVSVVPAFAIAIERFFFSSPSSPSLATWEVLDC